MSMDVASLPPLPVAVPLAVAGLLLAGGKLLPRNGSDVLAAVTALVSGGLCLAMALGMGDAPLVYWFGGWSPQGGFGAGHVLGIGFVVDQAGAWLGVFIALMFAVTIGFAWGFFKDAGAHFHVLMLLFMAAMTGFCLTHDLFNMFVWFEVMSVAGYALTGYALRADALSGAINFTLVNTLGSYCLLAGIGLIYAVSGALDFTALAEGAARAPASPLVGAAFALAATGFLVKAAQVPFQFWLADAHAVAPSPVSVLFSGIMVSLGLFGVARLVWAVFPGVGEVQAVVHTLLLGMGAVTAVLGGVMALLQRHIKRLLAFSTISHAGIMLVGIGLLAQQGLAGMLVYLVGHGLVKGSLFTVAGILLATCGGIDEIGLRGRGRGVWPAGVAMALGGLLLAGLPLGLMDAGSHLVADAAEGTGQGWALVAVWCGAVCTGAAVLRVAGRVFLGLGPVPGEEEHAPTADEQEAANRPFWAMMVPTALLLALALPFGAAGRALGLHAALGVMRPDLAAITGMPQAALAMPALFPQVAADWLPWTGVGLAVALAVLQLEGRRLPHGLGVGWRAVSGPVARGLQALHSGLAGDYVTWLAVGLAGMGLAFALV